MADDGKKKRHAEDNGDDNQSFSATAHAFLGLDRIYRINKIEKTKTVRVDARPAFFEFCKIRLILSEKFHALKK